MAVWLLKMDIGHFTFYKAAVKLDLITVIIFTHTVFKTVPVAHSQKKITQDTN